MSPETKTLRERLEKVEAWVRAQIHFADHGYTRKFAPIPLDPDHKASLEELELAQALRDANAKIMRMQSELDLARHRIENQAQIINAIRNNLADDDMDAANEPCDCAPWTSPI